MEEASMISDLAKRRTILAEEISRAREKLKQMLLDLNTLDAASI
jgi:histone H3/H4